MLFNANSAIAQLYHGEKYNYLQRAGDEISFVLEQHIYQQILIYLKLKFKI